MAINFHEKLIDIITDEIMDLQNKKKKLLGNIVADKNDKAKSNYKEKKAEFLIKKINNDRAQAIDAKKYINCLIKQYAALGVGAAILASVLTSAILIFDGGFLSPIPFLGTPLLISELIIAGIFFKETKKARGFLKDYIKNKTKNNRFEKKCKKVVSKEKTRQVVLQKKIKQKKQKIKRINNEFDKSFLIIDNMSRELNVTKEILYEKAVSQIPSGTVITTDIIEKVKIKLLNPINKKIKNPT